MVRRPAARSRRLCAAAIVCVALLGVVATATARPSGKSPESVLSVTFNAGSAEVGRAHGSVFVSLKGVRDIDQRLFRGTRTTRTHALALGKLRRSWRSRLGPQPIVQLAGRGGRATLYALTGPPTWNAADGSLTFSANATPANARGARAARELGGHIRARVLPTRAHVPGRGQPAIASRQTTSSPTCTTVQPARANLSFCLPYQTALGTGNTSWVNVLSGTMQTTPSCQQTPILSPIGGNVTVSGEIDVYQDAASAQAALSASMQVGYSKGLVSAEAKASFSESSSTSANAVYAIAQVNLVNGTVNLGRPSLSSSATNQAAAIDGMDDALAFLQQCGDSVPVSYTVGASWMSVLQLNTASQSAAQSLYASVKGSVAGVSAATSFSDSVESNSYTQSIVESDYCAGPPSCTSVKGYQDPASAGGNVDQAMAIFTNNYSLMLTNLSGLCNPGPTYSDCITQINYQPIYTLLTGGSSTSPSTMVSDAATSVYSVQSNFNSWATGYQALMTANSDSWSYWDWDIALDDLQDGAQACDINGLTSSDCSNQFQWCWNEISYSLSSQSADCLPSAFFDDNLYGLVSPYSIDPDA